MPVLVADIGAHALPELSGDLVGGFTDRRERGALGGARAGQQRVDGGTKESAVPAGRGEDLDLAVVGPAAERVGIHAEHPAGFAEGQPVASFAGRGLCGNTVNLGETRSARRTVLVTRAPLRSVGSTSGLP